MWNLHRIIGIRNLFFILALIILSIYACGFGGDISTVKNGYINFDKSITVGQAFEGYKYFGKKEWTTLKDEQGRRYVNFKTQMNQNYVNEINDRIKYRCKIVSCKYPPVAALEWIIQFTVNHDGTFFISGSKCSWNYTSGQSGSDRLRDNDFILIYKNKFVPDEVGFWF
jgi:hypothetical protein